MCRLRRMMSGMRRIVLITITTRACLLPYMGTAQAADTNWLGISQVEIALFSVGGRGTYWNQGDGPDRWFGRAQLRIHPLVFYQRRWSRRLF